MKRKLAALSFAFLILSFTGCSGQNQKATDTVELTVGQEAVETEVIDTDEPGSQVEGIEKERILSKFSGFWLWDDEENIKGYLSDDCYNGIFIYDRGENNSEDGVRYDFEVTRGNYWTDESLVSISENELVFQYTDDMLGERKVVVTYLDENHIQVIFHDQEPNVAVKSTSIKMRKSVEN